MKTGTKRVLSLLLAVVLVFSLGAAALAVDTVPADALYLSGTGLKAPTGTSSDYTLELYAGSSAQLTATVAPEDYDYGVTWTSADTEKVTVDQTGNITAVKATDATSPVAVTVKVTGRNATGGTADLTKTIKVTVKPNAIKEIEISGTGVEKGKDLVLKKGASVDLTATAKNLNGTTSTENISWSSSDFTKVGYTSAGKITAKAPGTSTITAASTTDATKKATLTVHVYEVAGLKASVDKTTGHVKAEATFTEGYAPSGDALTAIMKNVTWASSNTKVATVDKDGKITNLDPGKTVFTATLDGKTATCEHVVTGVIIPSAPTTGTVDVVAGGSKSFTANYAPTDANIKWTLTGEGFAIEGADNAATVKVKTLATALANQTATLTATVTKGTTSYGTKSVTLKVLAATEPTSIALEKTSLNLTIGGTATLDYTLTPSNANYSKIEYQSSDPTVATVTDAGLVTALKAGTTTIKAILTKMDGTTKLETTTPCTVTVKAASTTANFSGTVKTSGTLSMASIKSSMATKFTGDDDAAKITLTLPTSTTYGTLYKTTSTLSSNKVESGVEYTLADFAKFSLAATSKVGTYAFNYTLTDGAVTLTGKVTITIGSTKADVTLTLTGTDTYSFNSTANKERISAYNAIRNAVYEVAGTYPTYIKFGSVTGSSYGTMYDDGDDTYSKTTYYSFGTDLKYFTFEPAKKGTWTVSFTAYSSKSSSADLATGTLSFVISSVVSDDTVTVNLDNAKDVYSFDEKTDEDGVSAYNAIRYYVEGEADEYPKYIKFGSATGSSYGTLYDHDEDAVSKNTRYSMNELKNFTFEPEKKGTYSISFTAYSGTSSSSELAEGTLEIVVPSGSSKGDTITVTLDDDEPYEFSSKTEEDGVSAAKAIASAIRSAADETYEYLKFTSVNSSTKVGTLYANDDEDNISKNTKYYNDDDASKSVYDLYFVPKADGTYECEFTAYNDDNDELGDFTLEIVVGEAKSTGDGDLYVNVAAGKTVTFGESMFETWFKAQAGSSYKLAYVTFDDVDSSKGTFKHSSTSFDPDGDIKFYTDSFTGSTGSSAKYLKNVKYTAASSTGCIEVEFTCYGGTSTSKYNTEKSGVLYIFVTDGAVKNITYSVKSNAVELKESDFLSVYKTAMGTGSSSTKYYIELLNVPGKGNLYYDYTSASKPGTKLTGSNLEKYKLYANGSSSSYGIEDITYVPAATATGTVSVDYVAYSSSGTALYAGTIDFKYGAATKNITCYSDGYTFKATDFYSSADSDPIKTVAFSQPAYGKLMLNYTNGYGTILSSSTALYTAGSVKNAYAISAVTYVPSAGFNGSVSINYSAVTESGSAVNGTITMTVKTKTASSTFTDVTASGVGSWAADSIDYAKAWGLVNGTGATTFSPNSTMTRGMLVTVLYRAAGSPSVSGTCPFTDVPQAQYYYNAVIWASRNGIANGISTTKFNPEGNVTREQVATLLYNFAKYKGISTVNSGSLTAYTDKGSVSSYATTAMTWAVSNGYITSTSTSAKVLSPAASATRAQVSVMLHRFLTDF